MSARARAAVVGCALALASSEARAQATCPEQTAADRLEEQGNALRAVRRDAEALALFRQSFALCRGARAQLRVGLAEAALGRWLEAERDVTAALSRPGDPWIAANRAAVDDALAGIGRHLGSLELRGRGGPGDVWIDGVRVATWPTTRPVRVRAGAVAFTVRAPGRAELTRTVEVAPGGLTREEVELARLPDPPTAPAAVTAPAPDPVAAPPAAGSARRTLAWVSAIGAAALAGGGVAAYLVGADAVERFNDDARCARATASTTSRGELCAGADTAELMAPLMYAGFIGAGALAITSAVLFATAPSARGRATVARFGCAAGPTPLGVTCGATF